MARHYYGWRIAAFITATLLPSQYAHAQSAFGFGDLAQSFSLAPPSFAAPEVNQQVPVSIAPPLGENESYDGPLWERSYLLGDPFHLRSYLDSKGVTFSLQEQDEVISNLTGGAHTGAVYDGLTSAALTLNMEKLAGISGMQINVSAFHFHGRSISADNLFDLNTASGLEADRGARLNELWLDQSMWGGLISLRIGQQSIDNEFMISYYSGLFINGGFGWPTLPSVDLPNGANAYPMPTPGIRLRIQPASNYRMLIAVFNGDPGTPMQNPSGTEFPLNRGVFAITEVQYDLHPGGEGGLPGFYHFGSYYNSNRFANPAVTQGFVVADGSRAASSYRNDWAIYLGADQLIWPEANSRDQGLGAFFEVIGAPGDRNQVLMNFNTGMTYKGLIPKRDQDTVGFGITYARISNGDTSGYAVPQGVLVQKGAETVVELTYQAELAPWWQMQPDLQYVFNPGAGRTMPNDSTRRIRDELIMGLRTTITF